MGWNLVKSDPEGGWITYSLYFGVVNQGSEPVMADLDQSGQATGQVETQEGHEYQLDAVSNGEDAGSTVAGDTNTSTIILPPQTPVTGAPHLFSTTFKVPQALHPISATLSNWLAVEGESQDLSIDLTKMQELGEISDTRQPLPSTIRVGSVDIKVSPHEMYIDDYGDLHWQAGYLDQGSYSHWDWPGVSANTENGPPPYDARFFGVATVAFNYSATNRDVAADATPDVDFRLVGGQHRESSQSGGQLSDSSEMCGFPSSIGPGQTVSGKLCFQMPVADVIGDGAFQLLVGGATVSSYGVSFGAARLANCKPAPVKTFLDEDDPEIRTESELSAVGQYTYKIITEQWYEARENETSWTDVWKLALSKPRSIALTSTVPGPYVVNSVLAVMDPSGTLVSSVRPDGKNWAYVDRVCSTPYYLVLSFAGGFSTDDFTWGVPYQVTVRGAQQAN